MSFSLDEYIDVAERVVHFRELYPEGTLQRVEWEIREVGNQRFVVYTAAAYRTPDDPRPGIGTAWEPFPGTTPYTRNSELMNAETAAWGRAIVALGLTSNRKLASRQEVKARREEQAQPPKPKPKPAPVSDIPPDWPPKEREPIVQKALEGGGVELIDEDFATMMASYMAKVNVADPKGFREFMEEMGVEGLPSDLRAKEARRGVLRGLPKARAVEIANVLIGRARALDEAAAALHEPFDINEAEAA